MGKYIVFFLFGISTLQLLGQAKVPQLIREGIFLFDDGRYQEAVVKYKDVLKIDQGNIYALYELAYTYEALEDYNSAIEVGKAAIKMKRADSKILSNFYVSYGNCLDKSGNRLKAIKIYKKGIKKYPNFHLLYFNLGVSLLSENDLIGAERCFQQALLLNPNHPSSHFYLGLVIDQLGKRIPTILALSRFILLEQHGDRSLAARQFLDASINRQMNKKDGQIQVRLNLNDLNERGKSSSFASINLLLDLASALDNDAKYKDESPTERLKRKFNLLFESLEDYPSKIGFYWKFYAPFFAALHGQTYIEPFVTLVQTEETESSKLWSKDNESTINNFLLWMEDFKWIAEK